MITKIVYAVTSDNSDIYLEQTYVTICSLRMYHPDACVVLVVDDVTDQTICGLRDYILGVITEKVVACPPAGYTKVERSRYLKTTLRNQIDGDYLFIDSDTVITAPLDEADSFEDDICAVIDYHVTLDQHSMFKSTINEQAKLIGWVISPDNYKYFNSGVMYVKDTPRTKNLFKRWNEEWVKCREKGFYSDQPSLGKINEVFGFVIKELDGIWNCQIAANGLRFFNNAKILHYFSSTIQKGEKENVYNLMNTEVFKSLKETGCLDDELKTIINNPKSPFATKLILLSGETLKVYQEPVVEYVYVLYNKYRKVYDILKKILERYANRKG